MPPSSVGMVVHPEKQQCPWHVIGILLWASYKDKQGHKHRWHRELHCLIFYSVRNWDSTVSVAKDLIFRWIFWMVAVVRVGNF